MLDARGSRIGFWLDAHGDSDPGGRASRDGFLDGIVLAHERVGALAQDEAERWRERVQSEDDRSVDVGSELGPDAVARGEQYLTELIARVEPLGRGVDPAATRRYSECEAAIMALHRVGALDDRARARWLKQLLDAHGWGFVTEPAFHDQRTERIAEQAELQAREDAGEIRRVIVGPGDQHDRLAIVAIVVHADVTRVHFHYLAEPAEWNDGLGGLVPPVKLFDDTGVLYKPAQSGPDCQGTGDASEPGDFVAVTGDWEYKPAAASDAQQFTVEHRGHVWVLRDPNS